MNTWVTRCRPARTSVIKDQVPSLVNPLTTDASDKSPAPPWTHTTIDQWYIYKCEKGSPRYMSDIHFQNGKYSNPFVYSVICLWSRLMTSLFLPFFKKLLSSNLCNSSFLLSCLLINCILLLSLVLLPTTSILPTHHAAIHHAVRNIESRLFSYDKIPET